MVTKLHCPCGHQEPVAPSAVKRQVRCKACGATLTFSSGEPALWLVVEGMNGTMTLAVPIPLDVPLKIGSAEGSWFGLPRDIADERQVELTLKPEGGLSLRHTGKDKAKGTWINQARVLSGVLHVGDVLKIGPWEARVAAHPVVLAMSKQADRGVIVDEDVQEEEDEKTAAAPVYDDAVETGKPRFSALRVTLCLVVIAFAGLYLMRSMIWPGISDDMPRETTYYCPADGSEIRASWSSGPPKCPQCGQLCLGPMRYKPVSNAPAPPTTKPETKSSDAPAADKDSAESVSQGEP